MPNPGPSGDLAGAERGAQTHRRDGESEPRGATSRGEVTELLSAVRRGEAGAMNRLVPLVYDELRTAAHRQLAGRRQGQTLDTSDLIHETYLKLVDRSRADWRDRTHFLAASAVAMRHILVDSARRRAAAKRGGKAHRVPLRESMVGAERHTTEILAVDQALSVLAAVDPKLARLVELRFFGGLSIEEIAELRGVSTRTILRDWRKARAFLYRAVRGEGGTP